MTADITALGKDTLSPEMLQATQTMINSILDIQNAISNGVNDPEYNFKYERDTTDALLQQMQTMIDKEENSAKIR